MSNVFEWYQTHHTLLKYIPCLNFNLTILLLTLTKLFGIVPNETTALNAIVLNFHGVYIFGV